MRTTLRWIVLAIGLLEVLVVFFHVLGIEQTPYWIWPWRNGRVWPLYPAMALCALPMVFGIWARYRGIRDSICLLLICVSIVLFQVVGLVLAYRPFDQQIPVSIIEDRFCTSSWTVARQLVHSGATASKILADYPKLMVDFYVHSREKPPGWVLFYFFLLRVTGSGGHAAALIGAILIAVVTAVGAAAVYWLSNSFIKDRNAAFWAACIFALVPSVIAIYPQFDSCYPAVVCLMSVLWLNAIRRSSWFWAVAFGCVVGVASCFVYNILVAGIFVAGLAVYEIKFGEEQAAARIFRAVCVSAAVIAVLYLGLWMATSFNPVTTLLSAMRNQKAFDQAAHRSFPKTIPADVSDFLFGTGRMVVILAGCSPVGRLREQADRRRAWTVVICLGQIVLVGMSGLLRGETARVWCFMVPMVALPAGWELARWPARWRAAVLIVLGLLMLVMVQNVQFNTVMPDWVK